MASTLHLRRIKSAAEEQHAISGPKISGLDSRGYNPPCTLLSWASGPPKYNCRPPSCHGRRNWPATPSKTSRAYRRIIQACPARESMTSNYDTAAVTAPPLSHSRQPGQQDAEPTQARSKYDRQTATYRQVTPYLNIPLFCNRTNPLLVSVISLVGIG